jgi:hypothetical protein
MGSRCHSSNCLEAAVAQFHCQLPYSDFRNHTQLSCLLFRMFGAFEALYIHRAQAW